MSDELKELAMEESDKGNIEDKSGRGNDVSANSANASQADAAKSRATVPPEESFTPEQLNELKTKAAKADDYWQRLLRQTADFDNYKKRVARERQEDLKFANKALLEKLIPVIDNFEMGLTAATNSNEPAVKAIYTGVSMVFNLFKSALLDAGLEEIDASGQVFDPNWHEAVSEEATAEVPEGHVVRQLRKGYRLKDRLVRPASVVVARKPSA
jgi:molecular chaperone GrpE